MQATQALFEAGRARWPQLALALEAFARHVARVAGEAPVEQLRAADLFLAAACLENVAGAHHALDREVLAPVRAGLTRLSHDAADEAVQLAREHLLISAQGRTPRLAEYRGQGSLRAWVTTVALRLSLTRGRSQKQTSDEGLLDLPSARQPELDFLKAQHREAFKAAFAQALAELPARERNVLRLHAIDGLNIAQIGTLYDAHRATVARWISAAREGLLASTRTALRERLGVSDSELGSVMDVVNSNLDLSLERMLDG